MSVYIRPRFQYLWERGLSVAIVKRYSFYIYWLVFPLILIFILNLIQMGHVICSSFPKAFQVDGRPNWAEEKQE